MLKLSLAAAALAVVAFQDVPVAAAQPQNGICAQVDCDSGPILCATYQQPPIYIDGVPIFIPGMCWSADH